MRKKIVAIVSVLALSLTACGGKAEQPEKVKGGLDGNWKVGYIKIDGRPLRCVTNENDAATNFAWGGVSCDWVEFHQNEGVTP